MEMKWIRHPNLPGQETEVPEQSLMHYFRSGWHEFTPGPMEATEVYDTDEDAADTSSEPTSETTPKLTPSPRRVASLKGDDK